jgi:hypothetical protein
MRDLSLMGRNTVLKSLAISKLIYPATPLHVPLEIQNKIQREMMTYIWNNETPKLKRASCTNRQKMDTIKIKLDKKDNRDDNHATFKITQQYMIPNISIKYIFTSSRHLLQDIYNLPMCY